MIENEGQLLEALDDIPYAPFELAVREFNGRTALVFADEDAVIGILRIPYEDEPCQVEPISTALWPLVSLSPNDPEPDDSGQERD